MKNEDDHDAVHPRKLFDEKAEERRRKLFGVAYSRTFDRAIAEDMAQEAVCRFLILMEKTNWQAPILNDDAYLMAILSNLVKDWRKTLSTVQLFSLDHPVEDGLINVLNEALRSNNPALTEEKRIYFDELRTALPWKTIFKNIDAADQGLIYLHAIEGLSFEEIAVTVGRNVDSVRYQFTKLYAKIRYRVRKICGDENLFQW